MENSISKTSQKVSKELGNMQNILKRKTLSTLAFAAEIGALMTFVQLS